MIRYIPLVTISLIVTTSYLNAGNTDPSKLTQEIVEKRCQRIQKQTNDQNKKEMELLLITTNALRTRVLEVETAKYQLDKCSIDHWRIRYQWGYERALMELTEWNDKYNVERKVLLEKKLMSKTAKK